MDSSVYLHLQLHLHLIRVWTSTGSHAPSICPSCYIASLPGQSAWRNVPR